MSPMLEIISVLAPLSGVFFFKVLAFPHVKVKLQIYIQLIPIYLVNNCISIV